MASDDTLANTCPHPMKATSNGVFQGDNPLHFALPLAILQICLVVVLTRGLAFLLRPFRQPRVIAEIIGGVLLGPSVLGRNRAYLHALFPPRSLTVLDTLANIGLLFFLFLVGLEMDLKSLLQTGKRVLAIAFAGISLPFILGIGSSFILLKTISKGVDEAPFLVFMGVAFSITAFPVLARILAELKLLNTDIGRIALSAAAINDVAAWILLALAVALSDIRRSPLVSLWVLFCGVGFVVGAILIFRPIFSWMARRSLEGRPVDEMYICATLVSVLAAGFVTDAIGIHALFGAFVLGIVVPKEGPFAVALLEKVEDLVSGLFLPLYFISSGLKTNVATIQGIQSWGLLALVLFTACFGKIVGTVLVSRACGVTSLDAMVLGFLMNSKGLVELIVLNIGRDRKVLNDQAFAIMVLMALFTTFITTPLVTAIYKPAKRASRTDYEHRTIERKDASAQLRILACFYSMKNLPTMINLIEASRGTEKSEGLRVYAMHLTELSERSSTIFMVHKAKKNGLPFWNEGLRLGSDRIVVSFADFGQLSHVSIRPMTAISAMWDIHEDICASAEEKKINLVILPFHKHQRVDGAMETTRTDFRWVNERVLQHAPCSVGILVDRGFGGATHVRADEFSSSITVLFFGGRDDREALTYGARLAEHPGVNLTVIHFMMVPEAVEEIVVIDMNTDLKTKDGSIDTNFLAEFRQKIPKDDSIKYEERMVKDADETVAVIREFTKSSLFLVGRLPEGEVVASLNGKGECPELGPVGNLLTSPDFFITASVLIVQQYYSQKSTD